MKRSRRVGLLAASASLVVLAGCYEEEAKAPAVSPPAVQVAAVDIPRDQKVFESLEACLADIRQDVPAAEGASAAPADAAQKARLQCVSDWEKARAEHEKTAPRFTSLAQCEAEFGPQGCALAPVADQAQAPAAAASGGGGGGGGDSFMPFMMGYMIGNALSPSYPVYHDRSGGYRSHGSDSARQSRLNSSSTYVSRTGTASSLRNSTSLSRPASLSSTRGIAPGGVTAPKATGTTSARSRSSGFGMGRSATGGRSSHGG